MKRLREYLKERNIPEDSLEANSILEGYEKGYQDAIDKACEWIKSNMPNYVNFEDGFIYEVDMADDFRKATEE